METIHASLIIAATMLVTLMVGVLHERNTSTMPVGNTGEFTVSEPATLETVMGWVYPGPPACAAFDEVAAGQTVDVLKVEYFTIASGGEFKKMTEQEYGCNAYGPDSVTRTRQLSNEQFVTISSSYAPDMAAFLAFDNRTHVYTDELVAFVVAEDLTGIELDFEDFGGWSESDYAAFLVFVERLGSKLHQAGKQLMIDVPPTRNATEEAWYQLRLADLIDLPIDYVVVMAYDYQFDHGVGTPVAPLSWIKEVVTFTKSRYPFPEKLVVGVPSYGYAGAVSGTKPIRIMTKEQLRTVPGFSAAKRDSSSAELMWVHNNTQYVYQDTESIDAKVDAILASGVGAISVWHLGGNDWLSSR